MICGTAPRSAGGKGQDEELPAPSGGRTRPLLATGLMPGDELGLTVEPAGGTAKPTTTPILVIPLRT